MSPVICYEVIFPAAVTGPGARPRFQLTRQVMTAWARSLFERLGARVTDVDVG